MSARLTLVAHASTPATVRAAFPLDEGLESRGRAAASAARGRLGRVKRAVCSPAAAARETADGLALDATPDQGLADWDLGVWRGSTLDDVVAGAPAVQPPVPDASGRDRFAEIRSDPARFGSVAVTSWLSDPDAAPHGGESLASLLARVAAWLDGVADDGSTVAVTHAAVVRAAVVVTLSAPPSAFWRIDVAPLTATVLRGEPGRWTVRGAALPLAPSP